MVFCSKCGDKAASGATFCPKCGAKLDAPSTEAKPSKKFTQDSPKPVTGGGLANRATPNVQAIVTGSAHGEQSTAYYETNSTGVTKPGLPPPTYGKQPAWAYAEQDKNKNKQYKDGQFRSHNV